MKNSAIGTSWEEARTSLFTPEEIAASDMRVDLLSEIIKARHDNGLSQRELGKLSGAKQPVIARMEQGRTSPQIDTVLKLLAAMGKTLKIVPIKTK
jgi:predicted transcriptional regulator